MKLDRESLYSLSLQPIAAKVAAQLSGDSVVDAFCGAGGNSIAFALAGKRVVAIELNPERLEMAKYNAGIFGVADRITFISGDATTLLTNLKSDAVFLDMPWGGPSYSQLVEFKLENFTPDGNKILSVAFAVTEQVALKLPKNFLFPELDKYAYLSEPDYFNSKLVGYTAYLRLK